MKEAKFIKKWEKTRRRGAALYILECAVLTPAAGVVGKIIGEYIAYGIFFRPFETSDYIGLVFLCAVSVLMGLYLWKHNENRYKKVTGGVNGDKD
jgi:hypothetical protein